MKLWVLLVLIYIGPGIYTSETKEVYGTQLECYQALRQVETELICLEVK